MLPKRWVVERTFSCLGKYCQLDGCEYETTVASREVWVRSCMSNLMQRKLARKRKIKT
jgi:transposase